MIAQQLLIGPPALLLLTPLLMLMEGATAPPPAIADGHLLEQQLQATMPSARSVPPLSVAFPTPRVLPG
jgi:hypothetical protein